MPERLLAAGVPVGADLEEQVGDPDVHALDVGHVGEDQRLAGGGLEDERAAAQDAVEQVAFVVDIVDPPQRHVVAAPVEDAVAG